MKEKLPKKMRRKTDDDDELFMLGMYNKYLNTDGYDVDDTANKKIQVDFPEIERIEWLYDSQVKDYQNLLKNRRNKMTQTFRYLLRQNETPYSSVPPSEKDKNDNDDDDDDDDDKPSQLLSDVATVAKIGGKALYYTGKGIYQGVKTGIEIYDWLNEEEDEDVEPPINEEVFTQTQGLLRRGASRSRSASPEEQPSGSNQAMRLLRRGASRSRSPEEQESGSNDAIRLLRRGGSRSRSETPPKRNPKKK